MRDSSPEGEDRAKGPNDEILERLREAMQRIARDVGDPGPIVPATANPPAGYTGHLHGMPILVPDERHPGRIRLGQIVAVWETVAPLSKEAWERLSVSSEGMARLDGTEYRLRGQAADFLRRLIEARGDPLKADALESSLGERPSRIWKKLPEPIQRIVERPGRGQCGYRLRNPAP